MGKDRAVERSNPKTKGEVEQDQIRVEENQATELSAKRARARAAKVLEAIKEENLYKEIQVRDVQHEGSCPPRVPSAPEDNIFRTAFNKASNWFLRQ